MCGLTGLISLSDDRSAVALTTQVEQMADTLHHRGPDDSGVWVDERHGIGFAFKRLAIVDTSPLGHQPMTSASGRYVMVFNGEVYNHKRLRTELDTSFRGGSDTETLLAAIEAWGLDTTLQKIRGQFAIALWDRHSETLSLVRDRLGEKPLYYGWIGDTFLFGSELRALRAHPEFNQKLDINALAAYFRRGMVPSPMSIFEGISKLSPGCLATLDFSSWRKPEPVVSVYWSVEAAMHNGSKHPFSGSPEDAVEHLDGLLQQVIQDEMIADVPLGAFLSGGVDSSLVVALMQSQSSTPVQTCSIGFDIPDYDEAPYAKAVARHIGADHEELYVSAQDAMNIIPDLGSIWDEPFADSSQIPTYLVSRLARKRVTVSLTGDGADEVFAGYANYRRNVAVWSKFDMIPGSLRSAVSKAILAFPTRPVDMALSLAAPVLPSGERGKPDSRIVRRYARLIDEARDRESYFQNGVTIWKNPGSLLTQKPTNGNPFIKKLASDADLDYIQLMCLRDLEHQLPDDMLVKVDRASMANSLEARAPFLDHRVVEFAASLPTSYKIRGGAGKWVVKETLMRYVPRHLIDRPKRGFVIPIEPWLRGPLRGWADDLINHSTMQDQGIVHMEVVRKLWTDFLAGSPDAHPAMLWYVLQFEQWLRAKPR